MSFPPPPSKVHSVHNQPCDQTEPNPLGRTFLHARQPKWYALLQINPCFEKPSLLELTSLHIVNNFIPISAYHYKGFCHLFIFYFLTFRELPSLLCYSVFQLFAPLAKRLFREQISPKNMRKVFFLFFSICCRPLHKRIFQH